MSDTILSPNMNLPVPEVGIESGPAWASDINSCLGILDQHSHTSGQGVLITPAALNINTDLPINGNNLTLVNTVRFNNLSASLPGTSPNLGVIYEAGNDLYYNDGVGNTVQITKSGTVNATSSGISSGTATASFAGAVLVVDSNVNTPGNIQAGSILIGNNVSGSSFAQLQAPSALAANYSLTLPPTNPSGGTVFLTYDASNNEGIGPAVTAGITSANIGAAAIARSNIVALGQQISASLAGVYTSPTDIGSVTITTGGSPVMLFVQASASSAFGGAVVNFGGSFGSFTLTLLRSPGSVPVSQVRYDQSHSGLVLPVPFQVLDVNATPGATYLYTIQISALTATSVVLDALELVAYETVTSS
jgi:hypothetical protein